MNIRLSLKLVFFSFMLAFGAAMAYAFFVLSFEFYVQGTDDSIAEVLVETARDADLGKGETIRTLGFTITRDWNEIPEKFRYRDPEPPTEPYKLREFFEFPGPDSAPTEINDVLMVQETGEAPIYISKSRTQLAIDVAEPAIGPYRSAILIAVFSSVAFSLLLIWTLRMLVKPLENLQAWAGSLTIEALDTPAPSFRFREFSSLAEIVRGSLSSVSAALENEHEFLQFASHELRSPLTSMRGNVDLLQRDDAVKSNGALQRIDRATQTMTQLVQTLLWLSRDEQTDIEAERFSLEDMTCEVIEELDYVRAGKNLDLQLETTQSEIIAVKSAVRITISNLIRNAFQHAESGAVSISQKGDEIRVANPYNPQPDHQSNELGFGLGTRLISKLVDQFGWKFEAERTANEHVSRIVFVN